MCRSASVAIASKQNQRRGPSTNKWNGIQVREEKYKIYRKKKMAMKPTNQPTNQTTNKETKKQTTKQNDELQKKNTV